MHSHTPCGRSAAAACMVHACIIISMRAGKQSAESTHSNIKTFSKPHVSGHNNRACMWEPKCHHSAARRQASKQASERASKQASEQASEQASQQASKPASQQASEQASENIPSAAASRYYRNICACPICMQATASATAITRALFAHGSSCCCGGCGLVHEQQLCCCTE